MTLVFQPIAFDLALPWHYDQQRELAFKKTLKRVLVPVLILFLLIPWVKIIDRELMSTGSRIVETRIVLEPVAPPPEISQPAVALNPSLTEVASIVEKPAQPSKSVTTEKSKAGGKSATKRSGQAPEAPAVDKKLALASSKEITELATQLKSLRGALDIAKMQNKNVSVSTGGTVAASDRDVLGADVAMGKGKNLVVNDAIMRGDVVILADHKSTAVESGSGDGYGGGGRNGTGTGGGGGNVGRSGKGGNSGSGNGEGVGEGNGNSVSGALSNKAGGRDMESIRSTLEKTKSSVYTLYQRALLDHPDLAGKFTFSMIIEPNGSISKLKLVASELGISDLDTSILDRIRQVNFGAKDVSATVVEYKFVFFPS